MRTIIIILLILIIGVIMGFNPIQPSSGYNANNTQINKLAADVRGSKVTQVFKDSTDRRVLLGKGKDDFYGLKVSKPGVDVYDATDSQLIFNSDQNVFKVAKSGTVNISYNYTASAATGSHTLFSESISHNLGSEPMVLFILTSEEVGYSYITGFINSGSILQVAFASNYNFVNRFIAEPSDSAVSVSLQADWYQSSGTIPFVMDATLKYYILQETAN